MQKEIPALVRHNADAKANSKAEKLWMQQLQKKIQQKKLQTVQTSERNKRVGR